MWELDYKESWVLKNGCFWTVVLEKTLESPWDCKEIQPVHPKGDQSWVFIGGTEAEAETPILWPPVQRTDSFEKTLMLGLKAGGEGDDRGWDGWMASPTWWTWVWVNSRSWWWTGRPGVLQSMGSQRLGDDWATLTCFPHTCSTQKADCTAAQPSAPGKGLCPDFPHGCRWPTCPGSRPPPPSTSRRHSFTLLPDLSFLGHVSPWLWPSCPLLIKILRLH